LFRLNGAWRPAFRLPAIRWILHQGTGGHGYNEICNAQISEGLQHAHTLNEPRSHGSRDQRARAKASHGNAGDEAPLIREPLHQHRDGNDITAGAVTDTYEYDAFGNLIASTGTTPNTYLYRGERYDSDLGLYYLRARWFNPVTGRFMTRDPYQGSIYDPASLHRYNYSRANPVNFIDPSGRAAATEYAQLALNVAARVTLVGAEVSAVGCAYFSLGSATDLVGQNIGQQITQLSLLWQGCAAKITARKLYKNAAIGLLGIGAGRLLGAGIGWLLEGAEGGGGTGFPTLFRGTSEGFPGSPALQRLGITPTSTNPAVGTLFATYSGQYGNAVLQIASPAALNGIELTEANVLASAEGEVALSTTPADFAARAETTISAADARAILQDMGYSSPGQIYDLDALRQALAEVPTLTAEEIQQFINAASNLVGAP